MFIMISPTTVTDAPIQRIPVMPVNVVNFSYVRADIKRLRYSLYSRRLHKSARLAVRM